MFYADFLIVKNFPSCIANSPVGLAGPIKTVPEFDRALVFVFSQLADRDRHRLATSMQDVSHSETFEAAGNGRQSRCFH